MASSQNTASNMKMNVINKNNGSNKNSNILSTNAPTHTFHDEDNTTSATESTASSPLLDLPPEIRKMIWTYTLQGDGAPIHVDHLLLWAEVEWASRLNITLVNKQIRFETTSSPLFHSLNTFVFAAADRRKNYGMVENIAEWLAFQSEKEREAIKRVVVCSNHSKEVVEFAWKDAGNCDMDSGFVVGGRIDEVLSERVEENASGLKIVVREWESWGREEGHYCNKGHFELVRKGEAKGKGKGKGKK